MIILEGPDGSGKTTLLDNLKRRYNVPVHPRFSTSVGGPLDNLSARVSRDMHIWDNNQCELFDRHPFISEFIYGPIIRGHVKDELDSLNMMALRAKFMREALIILCLPPVDVVKANVLYHPGDHMAGVEQNIIEIYEKYQQIQWRWPNSINLVWYDYTMHDLDYVYQRIEEHRAQWNVGRKVLG
jgi:thymidylate kinase